MRRHPFGPHMGGGGGLPTNMAISSADLALLCHLLSEWMTVYTIKRPHVNYCAVIDLALSS